MHGFFAIVFAIAWLCGVCELALIPKVDALNMRNACDFYLANKHTGFQCINSNKRIVGALIITYALITLLLSVKSRKQIVFIIAAYVSVTMLMASVIRIIYFFQGRANLNYLSWSFVIALVGLCTLQFLVKFPFKNQYDSKLLKYNSVEMHRLEQEIDQRKKEKAKRISNNKGA